MKSYPIDPVRWIPTKTYLYFIKCNSYIKIGISSRPKSRLHSIQVGSPYKCKLVLAIPFPSRAEAAKEEEYYHKKYEYLNKRGEWFYFKDGIKKIVEGAIYG